MRTTIVGLSVDHGIVMIVGSVSIVDWNSIMGRCQSWNCDDHGIAMIVENVSIMNWVSIID